MKKKKNFFLHKILRDNVLALSSKKDTKQIRRVLNISFIILFVLGYLFLFAYNAFVFMSLLQLNIEPQEFDAYTTEDSIVLEGTILVFSQMDIRDLSLSLSLATDTGLHLAETSFQEDHIPRGVNTELQILITLTEDDLHLDHDTLDLLNQTKSIIFGFIISLDYAGYIITLQFSYEEKIGGFFNASNV